MISDNSLRPDGGGISRRWLITSVICVALVAAAVLQVVDSPAAHASAPTESCPPYCGKVAAGDPLLIPYMTVNPGLGWLALPASGVESYANDLKRNLLSGPNDGVVANVAAAKWTWIDARYSLLMVLVSSASLVRLHLGSPAQNAQFLCSASRGEPSSQLAPVAGVPGSVSGLCTFKSGSSFRGATVVAFERSNVAVLMEISTKSQTAIASSVTATAAQQQFDSLPSGGVFVSTNGLDWAFVAIWLLILAVIILCLIATIRRRKSWTGPFDALAAAFGRRNLALGMTLVAVVGAMAFSMLDFSLLHGVGQWYEAGFNDFWRSWASSSYMTYSGGYGHIYALNTALETAPAWLFTIAPVSRLAFGLPFPYPSAVLYPNAFWLAGPVFLGAMVLPMCAGDRWMQYLSVTDIRRRVTVLSVMAITLPPIALFGHSEDLIALGAMLYGLIAALEGRSRAAGVWLGVAFAFQFLAILAIPIALVLLKRRQWLEAIVPMVIVPLIVLVVPLSTEPSATLRQLLHQQVFFDMGFISPTWYLDPGVGAFIRVVVALAAIPAAFVLARLLPEDKKASADIVLWTLALLFALRVCEPELLPYFLAPTLALFPISASRGPWWRLAGASVLAVWLNWWLHDPVQGRWLEWLFLIAQLAALGWLGWPSSSLEAGDAKITARKGSPPARRAGRARPVRSPRPLLR
jgi:hypothetical protein